MIHRTIPPYFDGFSLEEVSCVDLSFAAALGAFNFENYYYYLFCKASFINWLETPEYSQSCFLTEISKMLHIHIEDKSISNCNELKEIVIHQIESGGVIILNIPYNSLYYSSDYVYDGGGIHPLVINGYDDTKDIFMITDTKIFDNALYPKMNAYFNGTPLLSTFLKSDYLLSMWKEGAMHTPEEELQSLLNNITIVKKIGDFHASLTGHDVINWFLQKITLPRDNLFNLVNMFNKLDKNNLPIELTRRDYFGYINAFLGSVKFFLNQSLGSEEKDTLTRISDDYIESRKLMINLLTKYSLTNRDLPSDAEKNLKDEITAKNESLFDHLRSYSGGTERELSNYSYFANIEVDSEYNEKITYACERLTNRSWSDGLHDLWHSTGESNYHWIIFTFTRKPIIRKIVLRHFGVTQYNTSSYNLMASQDKVHWTTLAEYRNNIETTNQIFLDNVSFSYYKVDIIKPNQIDNYARIYEVEFWGIY